MMKEGWFCDKREENMSETRGRECRRQERGFAWDKGGDTSEKRVCVRHGREHVCVERRELCL